MPDDEPEIRFEAALDQLEQIVDALQRGEPELSSALAKYEQGVALLSRCYGLLERAERSVTILTGVNDDGEAVTIPFDAAATLVETAVTAKPKPKADGDDAPKPARRRRVAKPEPTPEPEIQAKLEVQAEPEYDRFDPPF
ncbi:MAG: exodeoxyribonuclease VII small subunit [Paludisphaera borealis]|uniref:exodeoxyribonuclease VII small subunit n=1 Tax=Paludisphaera borealis TaxID=1387353 RepID=UPI002845FA6E|nr:exodeoxyribonuclease VII small subunit [Paludisphaera borealis]MDR3622463.1 exodeoxyribonuclease VII small subunit [Paludisphaera borealis]